MNHTLKAKLLIHMDANPDDLTDQELGDYIWEVEQLLQETRELLIHRRSQEAHDNPVRP